MLHELDQIVGEYESGCISRRGLLARLAALMAVGSGVRLAGAAEAPTATFEAVGLNHIALRVRDVPRSRDFYIKHLGLTVLRDSGEQSCFLGCGDHFVALFQNDQPAMDHYCYSIKKYEVEDAVKRLEQAKLAPRRSGNRVYFDDPDGLEVQVAAADNAP